ncbi:Tyrosine-protein phosphatase YVH1 [Pseudozyma hubeiensis]|nr:Tyrosine-protein phosphatase YVH1 [Pseudozyma hubeiensis]
MDEVLPGLWVGGVRAAMDVDYLSQAGITHMITCMKQQIPVPPPLADGRTITRAEMKHVRIDDDEKAPILVHFAGCNELISSQLEEEWTADDQDELPEEQQEESYDEVEQLVQGRQKRNGKWGTWSTTGSGTVLIHCQAGCSRSVAIAAAYLMHTRRIDATTAISMIRRRRPSASPNSGFMAQLELYAQVGFEVDMKWQSVRRFLMSKTDILNGDSMDDMLLSYYPSPYPSPKLCASGVKSFTSIRSDDDGGGGALDSSTNEKTKHFPKPLSRSASSSSTTNDNAQRISHLSSINLPPSALDNDSPVTELVTSMASMSSNHRTDDAAREVKVTANTSGRLPGGVDHVRGHEGVANRGALAAPQFKGPKLRCKGCRRELAAEDHVVIHEPGRGQMAFEHRKRDVGFVSDRAATTNSTDPPITPTETNTQQQPSEPPTTAPPPPPSDTPRIRSAASLASQLPPHLAALRRPTPTTTPTSTTPGSMLNHPSCTSYFIEPMAWMTALSSGEVTGRLNCPAEKCRAKLGSWDWAGMQCGCGAWVTPAFSLHRSKVDEV